MFKQYLKCLDRECRKRSISFFIFCVPIHNEKLKFMEPSHQVNPPDPTQQFLCPLQKINSCLGTSQMAPAIIVPIGAQVIEESSVDKSRHFAWLRLYRLGISFSRTTRITSTFKSNKQTNTHSFFLSIFIFIFMNLYLQTTHLLQFAA